MRTAVGVTTPRLWTMGPSLAAIAILVIPAHCPLYLRGSMKSLLPADEEDALRRILRHHQVQLTDSLVKDLGALINWVHQLEQAKSNFAGAAKPPYLLSLLSTLGIYGGEAIGPTPPSGVVQ